MKTITVITGFGYFKDGNDRITDKATLPIGNHPLQDEYTYYEVENQEALDAIEVYQEPQPTPYNADTLISWAMSQLFAAELIPHFAAFLDFANKGTEASAANFRAYATAVELSATAETIITKAVELGANIEEVE